MTHLTCDDCHIQIALHADGSLHCSCDSADYQPGRAAWPSGWTDDTLHLETLQARELLVSALEDETDLREFVAESVDEADVMRQAKGDVAKAVEICRNAYSDFTTKEGE